MRLGGRAEDTETSEIEIEQIRRGVDAAKSPVHLEVVSLERLLEATAQYDLEDIPPEAVLDALADHRLVFLAGDRGGLGTRCLEVIGAKLRFSINVSISSSRLASSSWSISTRVNSFLK